MKQIFAKLIFPMGCLMLVGCQKNEATVAAPGQPGAAKPDAVAVVKVEERSRHFLAVARELELGGTLFAYADIEGDVLKLAGGMQEFMKNLAAVQPSLAPYVKDYSQTFSSLGFNDVKALGLSSVPDGSGFFRNRIFFYMPGKRTGLLAGLGGAAAPFARLDLAPEDTDIYGESEIDLPVVYATIREVVEQVAGENVAGQMHSKLRNAGEDLAVSWLSVIQGWKGHTAMVLRVEAENDWDLLETDFTIPAFSMLVAIDGIAPAVQASLEKAPWLTAKAEGFLQVYEVKSPLLVAGLKPVFVIDGSTLYVATSRSFYDECRHHPGGLAVRPEFQQALKHVGSEGNGLSYISPRFFTRLRQLDTMNPQLEGDNKRVLQMVMTKIPGPDRPLVAVRTNLADGILLRSYWDRSLKQDVAALSLYNPVAIGMLAAMAIPAFEKVRHASLESVVHNNLRQLAAAAEQYWLENGESLARYDDLVGPGKYIKTLTPVAGEDYTVLEFKRGESLRLFAPKLRKVIECEL